MFFTFAVALQCLSIPLIFAVCIYVFSRLRTRRQSYLFLYCLATLVNNIGYLIEITADSCEAALAGTRICYLGKVFIPFALFFFVLNLCKIKPPKFVPMIMAVFHLFIFILVLTCRWNHLYYTSITYTDEGLFRHNIYGHGIFYNIYTFVIVAYLLIGIVLLAERIRVEKSQETKMLLWYLMACSAIEAIGFFVFLTGITQGYDITAIAFFITTILMYIMILRHDLMNGLDVVKEHVVENLNNAVIAIDKWGDLFYCNEAALSLFPDISSNAESIISDIESALEENTTITRGDQYFLPDKQVVLSGKTSSTIYNLTDVTQLHNFTLRLEEQKNLAEKANASKSRFVSTVSHEIRTPMNAIVGMANLLVKDSDNLTEKQQCYLKNIQTSGESLVMIVNDILDQSKIEAGKMELVNGPYSLRPLISDVLMIIENRIGEKPVKLISEIGDDIPEYLTGDSLRIRQILINLMNNAVKFTEKGFIRLSVSCEPETGTSENNSAESGISETGTLENDSAKSSISKTVVSESDALENNIPDGRKIAVRFSVRDSGQGIKKDDLTKLGKAFSQVDVEKNHSKEGTGLGLSISDNFIHMMGGQLEVRSTYGEGSEFFFTIDQEIPEDIPEEGSVDDAQEETSRDLCEMLPALVVDDTEINLMILEELLSQAGIRSDTASSGKIALEKCRKNKYGIIFMDYVMPEMDGVETTRLIRSLDKSSPTDPGVPIIAITGDTSDETLEAFRRAGISDFLEKPVDPKKLYKAKKVWIRQ